jgi:acetyl-CoA carboxylase carboxyltransferase component
VSDEEKAQRLREIQARYEAAMDPRYAAARMWVDEIIDPRNTREVLARAIAAAAHQPEIADFRVGVLQT